MPFETTLDLLTLRRDGIEESQWPRLSCSQAHQAALEGSDLRLDAGREVLFQDQGQIRAFDDTHKLVFNRAGNLLELHEQGDIRLLTGTPTPTERLRLLATGQVGLGTPTPTQALDVVGTVKATAFQGNGAGLTGVRGTDATKVAKAGDTMMGPLTLTAAGTGLSITNDAAVGGTLTIGGRVGIGTISPGQALDVVGQGLFRSAPWAGAVPGVAGTAIGFDPSNAGGTGFLWSHTTTGAATRLWMDGNPIIFAPAGAERMRVDSGGNVGIGTSNPVFKLDVTDRIRLRDGPNGSAGLWLFRSGQNVDRAFVGMANDDIVGLWGNGGVGWAFQMNVNDGTVYIGSNKTGPFVRFNDDLWFADPQNGTIHTRNASGNGFGTMIGFFQPPSSREFKKEIRVLQDTDLEQLLAHTLQTELVHFRYKSDDASHRLHLGVIAEDAPDMMVGKDGQSLAISEYVAMLHGAIKALASRFADLRTTKDHLNASGPLLKAEMHDVALKRKGGEIHG
jgi:hypothetical protein